MNWRRSAKPEDILAEFLLYSAWATKEVTVAAVKGGLRLGKWALTDRRGGVTVGYTKTPLGRGVPVIVPAQTRFRHMHVDGASGAGKSTLLENMGVQDMRQGVGLIVIDPKGDLAPRLLPHIPPGRLQQAMLFDPTDTDRPVGFNILEAVPDELRDRAASEVVTSFEKLFGERSWGPRLEHVLRYSVLTLLDAGGLPLPAIPRLLLDEAYRARILTQVADPALRGFWEWEYPEITSGSNLGQVIGPVLNKLSPFLAYRTVRRVIGQRRSSFDLRQVLDQAMILIAHLPQSVLGEDVSNFLGALLVSKIQLAAMGRPSSGDYRPIFLYVDEFQNFSTSAFAKIVSEARSFSLGLIAANQYKEQLPRDLVLALDNTVAVRLSCQVDQGRHRVIYSQLQDPSHLPQQLIPPLPLGPGNEAVAEAVRQYSRQRYGRPRAQVEAEISQYFISSGEGAAGEANDDDPPFYGWRDA